MFDIQNQTIMYCETHFLAALSKTHARPALLIAVLQKLLDSIPSREYLQLEFSISVTS